jgi:glycogen synthase
MNVAIVASAFFPSVGGVEELVRQLAIEQRRRGGRAVVAVNRWPRDLAEIDEVDGVPVRRYAFRVGGGDLRQNLGALLLGGGELRKFNRDLRADAIDLLHVQCVSCNAPYAIGASRRLGLPLVVSLQGELTMDATGLFERKASARRLYRAALDAADAVTACSRQTLEEAERFYGRSLGHKARVIHNGVRLEDFERAQPYSWRRPYILAIGRHVVQKGFDTLLRAVARAGKLTHDLLIAGDGPERTSLEKLAGELGLGEAVRFVGKVDHDEAVRLFAGCSFFVLPSRHEPMGIVNLEAMAAAKAVLACEVGGVPELVVNGETGLLTAAEDVEAMASGITRLVFDADLRKRLGENGRKRAARFSWGAITDQYEQVYRKVLQRRPMQELGMLRAAS